MLERDFLLDDVSTRLFGIGQEDPGVTFGLEVEFIPQRPDRSVLPIFGADGTLELLRRIGKRHGWDERKNSYGVPVLHTPSGGVLSFEPGGQIEYSSPTFANGSELLQDVRAFARTLIDGACNNGVSLVTAGLDPYNGPERADLQLDSPRYANMARHFAAIGPAGARMMRQTTAVQVNIGRGAQPLKRWQLLNALVAPLTALFANSGRYAGENTGFASFRSQTWRETDPKRTGVFSTSNAAPAYLDFALDAAAILPPHADAGFPPFGAVLADATENDWRAHLSTLFPDVRPKGYFEIRCIDGQPIERYGAVLATIIGVTMDSSTSTDAEVLLPPASSERVARAGRSGLADYELRSVCEDLVDIALAGCRRQPVLIAGADVDEAEEVLRGLLVESRPIRAGAGYASRERLPR